MEPEDLDEALGALPAATTIEHVLMLEDAAGDPVAIITTDAGEIVVAPPEPEDWEPVEADNLNNV